MQQDLGTILTLKSEIMSKFSKKNFKIALIELKIDSEDLSNSEDCIPTMMSSIKTFQIRVNSQHKPASGRFFCLWMEFSETVLKPSSGSTETTCKVSKKLVV